MRTLCLCKALKRSAYAQLHCLEHCVHRALTFKNEAHVQYSEGRELTKTSRLSPNIPFLCTFTVAEFPAWSTHISCCWREFDLRAEQFFKCLSLGISIHSSSAETYGPINEVQVIRKTWNDAKFTSKISSQTRLPAVIIISMLRKFQTSMILQSCLVVDMNHYS